MHVLIKMKQVSEIQVYTQPSGPSILDKENLTFTLSVLLSFFLPLGTESRAP